jgi:DNA polymerase-3 subunit beta
MHFKISRESFLKPLQLVSGVVEKRQTLPVLSNVLLVLEGNELSLTGTDLEVELVGRVRVDESLSSGAVTVPARKLLDICKSLKDDAIIELAESENQRLTVKSGRSRFTLTTLPATEFPRVEEEPGNSTVSVPQSRLKELLDSTSFAMAQQDVRYYLNGMLFEVSADYLRVVATDGHRLAMETMAMQSEIAESLQLILPRKGVIELGRLLGDDGEVALTFSQNHIRASVTEYTFTSKLVDGKFPDYNRVLPKGGNKVMVATSLELRQAFTRASILSNEKYRGVRVLLSSGELKILANNPEQEEAEEVLGVEYEGDSLEIGFNVSYLIDVLTNLSGTRAKFTLSDPNSSALIEAEDGGDAVYVVMPMRL